MRGCAATRHGETVDDHPPVVASPGSGLKTLQGVTGRARDNPGKVKLLVVKSGGITHLAEQPVRDGRLVALALLAGSKWKGMGDVPLLRDLRPSGGDTLLATVALLGPPALPDSLSDRYFRHLIRWRLWFGVTAGRTRS